MHLYALAKIVAVVKFPLPAEMSAADVASRCPRLRGLADTLGTFDSDRNQPRQQLVEFIVDQRLQNGRTRLSTLLTFDSHDQIG
jgi:hypothetical protein